MTKELVQSHQASATGIKLLFTKIPKIVTTTSSATRELPLTRYWNISKF
jgi:hypothetical protein